MTRPLKSVRLTGGRRFGVVLGVLGALAATGCGDVEVEREARAPAVSLELHTLALQRVPGRYLASGTLEAGHTARITSKVPGYVREVRVQAGERVRQGDVLVVLEGDDLDARLQAARAGLGEAEEAEVEASEGLAAARAMAGVAATTYQRFKTLEAKRAVTAQEMDEAESRYQAAGAEALAAEARVRRVRRGLERARAGVAAAETIWGHTRVRAPFAGRVIERQVELGNLASPGMALVVLEQAGPLFAEVDVDESLSGTIRSGDTVEVVLSSDERTTAQVREVSPRVDRASRTFRVKVELSSDVELDSERYSPGRFVRVEFSTRESERLLVPETAVLKRGQLELVYVVESDGEQRVSRRLVTLGASRDGFVEVLSGLDAGESVALRAAEVQEVRDVRDVSDYGKRVAVS